MPLRLFYYGARAAKLWFAIPIAALTCTLTSAAADDAAIAQGRSAPRIGASFDTSEGAHGLWMKQFQKSLESFGATCVVLSAEGDAAMQEKQCNYLLRQGIDALAILPVDSELSTGIVQTAHSQCIPVLALNAMIPNCELDLFIGFDWIGGGKAQVNLLAAETKGAYFLLGHKPVHDDLLQFRKGQFSAFKAHGQQGDIELLGHLLLEARSSQLASRAISKVIAKHGPMNVILVTDPALALGAIQALALIGSEDETRVSGVDPDLDECRRIAHGQQHSSLYLPHGEAGKKSAEIAYQLSTRQPIQLSATEYNGVIEVPVLQITPKLLTRDNIVPTLSDDGKFTRAQLMP
ncbi:MAG: substrate-binding domain-containing protein [Verrucomicrobia bacterium]|nr:substrate-binding domain-containing protein [Verrucomicrobiota bacterium]